MNHTFLIFARVRKTLQYLLIAILLQLSITTQIHAEVKDTESRQLLIKLITGGKEAEEETLEALSNQSDKIIEDVVAAWRVGKISTTPNPDGSGNIVLLETDDRSYINLLSGEKITPSGDVKKNRASRGLRKKLKRIVTLLKLNSPDLEERIASAEKLGLSQNPEYLEILEEKYAQQTEQKAKDAFLFSLSISKLANGTDEQVLSAVNSLGELKNYAARDFLIKTQTKYTEQGDAPEILTAIDTAIDKIDQHQKFVDWVGALVRGLSTGAILLLVAYGLSITFGQMGVINMAHGEFIALGAYTTYEIQNFFADKYGEASSTFGWYFVIALPCAFLASAIAGAILEKGLIQFLYKRPLESLLATWGVSMVMKELFKKKFGAANVSVSSPEWLAGSYELMGVSMSYNRLLIIFAAILLIFVTWLLMNKTNWGLHVRATMQNRQMASSLGVPSGKVNMLTFAFGSGLAGLAGAFVSQIGNVGPLTGETYIVDSFMVVVCGGVGNLFGTALSAFGIGILDKLLEPAIGSVLGKVSVLLLIIVFLQFKPGGLFPSKSRNLED